MGWMIKDKRAASQATWREMGRLWRGISGAQTGIDLVDVPRKKINFTYSGFWRVIVLMNEPTSDFAAPAIHESTGLAWKLPIAVILSPFCALVGFIGEAFGDFVGFGAIALCFLLLQYILSRGLRLRQSWPILLGINVLPLCLGIFVIFVEQKSGAWRQGVLIIILSLACSFAGAALASHFSRKSLHQF
jgi:hypothetical protein